MSDKNFDYTITVESVIGDKTSTVFNATCLLEDIEVTLSNMYQKCSEVTRDSLITTVNDNVFKSYNPPQPRQIADIDNNNPVLLRKLKNIVSRCNNITCVVGCERTLSTKGVAYNITIHINCKPTDDIYKIRDEVSKLYNGADGDVDGDFFDEDTYVNVCLAQHDFKPSMESDFILRGKDF